jgi:hypothetical protein
MCTTSGAMAIRSALNAVAVANMRLFCAFASVGVSAQKVFEALGAPAQARYRRYWRYARNRPNWGYLRDSLDRRDRWDWGYRAALRALAKRHGAAPMISDPALAEHRDVSTAVVVQVLALEGIRRPFRTR